MDSVLDSLMIRILKIVVFFYLMGIAIPVYATGSQGLLTAKELAYIQAKKHIRVGVIDNEPPYSFHSHGKINGLSIDLLRILEQKSGLRFDYVLGPWFNVYSSFEKGELDVIDQISFTKERSQWMLFTPAYRVKKLVLFMRAGQVPSPFSGIQSLAGKKVGVIRNIYYLDAIRHKNGVNVKEYDDYVSLMKALAFGWIDAVVSGELTGRFIIRDSNLSGIVMAGDLNIDGITHSQHTHQA